jgi:hypothetical protein
MAIPLVQPTHRRNLSFLLRATATLCCVLALSYAAGQKSSGQGPGSQMAARLTDLANKVASDRRRSIEAAIQLPLKSDSSDIFEQRQDAAPVVFFNLSTSEAEHTQETPGDMFFNFTTQLHSQPMFVFNLTAKPRQDTAPVVFFNLTTTLPRQDTSPNITRYAYQEYQQAPSEGAYTSVNRKTDIQISSPFITVNTEPQPPRPALPPIQYIYSQPSPPTPPAVPPLHVALPPAASATEMPAAAPAAAEAKKVRETRLCQPLTFPSALRCICMFDSVPHARLAYPYGALRRQKRV